MAQQPRQELAPAFPTTRTRDATFQAHAKFTEIRLRSFLRLQSFQSGTIAHQPRHLQVDTQRRSCRVASTLFRIGSRFPRQTETGSNSSDSTATHTCLTSVVFFDPELLRNSRELTHTLSIRDGVDRTLGSRFRPQSQCRNLAGSLWARFP